MSILETTLQYNVIGHIKRAANAFTLYFVFFNVKNAFLLVYHIVIDVK